MTEQIYSFHTDDKPSLAQVGGKALSLISTTRAGLPVPGGLALTVAFFQPWTDRIKATPEWQALLEDPTKDNCETVQAIAAQLTLTDSQRLALDRHMVELQGTDLFAVRSSSPEEDLSGSSFAGMYETFLGTTRTRLEETIARAYSSMFGFRVMEYKAQNHISLEGTCISVIIQKQVASDVSGVGFSLNPMNNCYDEAVINASFGLGEAIVSGIVTPDTYVVEKVTMEILERTVAEKQISLRLGEDGGIEETAAHDPQAQALTQEQILELTELIKKTEAHYGHPVDTEWAYENGTLYLLQARPITTYVPLYPEMLTEPGERKKLYLDIMPLTQGFDESLSILGSDIWAIVIEKLKRGAYPSGPDGYILNMPGRQYLQLHHLYRGLGKRMARLLNTFDNAFEGREMEIYREYISLETTAAVKRGRMAHLRSLFSLLPALVRVLWNPIEFTEGTDAAVDELIKGFKAMKNDRPFGELVAFAFDSFDDHYRQLIPHLAGFLAFRKIKKLMKGTEGEELASFVVMDVPSNPTSTMGHAMFALARSPEFQNTTDAAEFAKRVSDREYSHEFMAALDEFTYKYGERGFKEIDVASRRLDERLDEFYLQLKNINLEDNQMLRVSARKREALDKMRAIAEKKGKRKAFEKAVRTLDLTYGHRETPKYLVVVMTGCLHRVALEIGDEFVSQGRLNRREQIFDLNIEQISRAQEDESLQLLPLIDDNLAPLELMKNVKQFPSFIDSRGKIFRKKIQAKDGDLAGMAVSNGVHTGRAKVLSSPYEKPLEPGEILVTVATEPSWTPIFVNASAVVLEIGGGLQHGAIIAREYGLPCVSGLPGVTEIIKDGDLLEVDGSNGIVKILEKA